MKIIAIYFACVTFVSSQTAQHACRTPDNQTGRCMALQQCDRLYSLLSPPLSMETRNFLRQSQCGFDGTTPIVCCPTKFTANDLPARCGLFSRDRSVIQPCEPLPLTSYPWMAMLHYRKQNGLGDFLCGGALINENYVVTAAHCVSGSNLVKNQFTLDSVRLGEKDLRTNSDCEEDEGCADSVADIQVAHAIVHQNYVPESSSQANDIALIRLARPVSFSLYISPICLPIEKDLQSKIYDDINMIIVGYGLDINATISSSYQRETSVVGINLNQCSNAYNHLSNKHLCFQNKRECDGCVGDSGGPLIDWYQNDNRALRLLPHMYLAGIHSFGSNVCGSPDHPIVFTRVDQYIDWILNHMEK